MAVGRAGGRTGGRGNGGCLIGRLGLLVSLLGIGLGRGQPRRGCENRCRQNRRDEVVPCCW
jgi:hypothetical protein